MLEIQSKKLDQNQKLTDLDYQEFCVMGLYILEGKKIISMG